MGAEKSMTFIDHLNELRRRLLVIAIAILAATIVSFIYAEPILEVLTKGISLIYIRPAEAMMAHFRIAFTAGVMLASPVIFYQFIAFLLPALRGREKRLVLVAVFMMFLLFSAGVCFAWFVVFPFALNFFAGFANERLLPYYTVSEYVSFATGFLLGFGLVFQMPLLFWVLGGLGVVSSRFLRKSRKYALIIILILSAIITPPDVISQVLMAIPMLGLYELGAILVAMTERSRRKREILES